MKPPIPTEHDESVALASYLSLLKDTGKILLYSHVPQETFTKNWGTKRRNKLEGVTKGVPDYIIVTPDSVLFIEMKRVKGGVVSIEQKAWIKHLDGKIIHTTIAKGFDQARDFIEEYL